MLFVPYQSSLCLPKVTSIFSWVFFPNFYWCKLKSISHVEFIFVYGVRYGVGSFFLFWSVDVQLFQRYLLENLPFSTELPFTTLWKSTHLQVWGLPRWLSDKESTCHCRRHGSIPGSRGSPGGRHGNPLQYSCLENPMKREACWLLSIGSQRVRHD